MRLFLVCFSLLCSQVALAQVILPSLLDVSTLKPVFIEFNAGKPQPTAFSSFKIEDSRPDQQTCGYIRFTPDYKKYNRLEWKDGIKAGERFLTKSFLTNPGADTLRLLIVLRNFFITQDFQSPQSALSLANVVYQSKVFVAADLFIEKKQGTDFLGRVDTLLTLQKWLGKAYNQMAEMALLHLVLKAQVLVQSGTPTNAEEFSAANRRLVSFPQKSYKNGFYSSYTEFLQQQPLSIQYRVEQRKKVRVAIPVQEADSLHLKNSWGFVEAGVLYVRKGDHYIPMQQSQGSWSGLGISFSEVTKVPFGGALLGNPFMLAADVADMAMNGPTAKLTHYCLYRLNPETGELQ